MAKKNSNRSSLGTLPTATLAQRLAALSLAQLMDAARSLAPDVAQDALCTAVLDELCKRAPGAGFDAFVAEIYS
jgi:hypothetical protein